MAEAGYQCPCGGGHETWGACIRAKRIQYPTASHGHFVKRAKVLGRYEWARRQGIQPQSPLTRHVTKAIRRSDAAGEPYRA